MKDIVADAGLVAKCGLYCGACNRFLKEKCPGCEGNVKASWCKVRSCVMEHGYGSCADCEEFADPADCAKFDNWMARAFGWVFNSNRRACVMKIRELGPKGFAEQMAGLGKQSLPRK